MNSFGQVFRISVYGESHGEGVGVVVDGCPAGIDIETEDFILDLSRRRAGKIGTTSRQRKIYQYFYQEFLTEKQQEHQ